VGLPARQRRVLDRIEGALRGSDPRLVAMFAIFGRLTRGEEMPRIEELRHRAAITLLRARLWLAAVRGWLGGRVRGRRPRAVLFPLALVLMTASIVLVARFGGAPRCSSTTAVAAAKLQPRSRLIPKGRVCRPAYPSPLLGR
jgi:hypothetical protein